MLVGTQMNEYWYTKICSQINDTNEVLILMNDVEISNDTNK